MAMPSSRALRHLMVAGVVVAALVGGAAVASHEWRRPVVAVAPGEPVPADIVQGVCLARGGLDSSGGWRPPWVDAHPDGAVVMWSPGLDARPCQAVLSRLSAADAGVLAVGVRTAPRLPRGTVVWPSDDGRAATVYLSYLGRADTEVVQFAVTGCSRLTAPGRGSVGYGDAVVEVLTRNAPPSWSRS